MKNVLITRTLLPSLAIACAGCTVYAPMQPAAPQLRDKGQAEVTATSFLNNRWEGAAAYSPVRYLSVRVAGGFRPDGRDTTYFRGQQFEVGLGGYYPLGRHWLLTGMSGYGRARSTRGFAKSNNTFFTSLLAQDSLFNYKARYHKTFGELGISYRAEWITLGFAYRLTKVGFESLTNNGVAVDLHHMTRSEPLLFMRLGEEDRMFRWLQLQWGLGTSTGSNRYASDNLDQRYIKEGKLFTTFGLVLYPDRFRRSK